MSEMGPIEVERLEGTPPPEKPGGYLTPTRLPEDKTKEQWEARLERSRNAGGELLDPPVADSKKGPDRWEDTNAAYSTYLGSLGVDTALPVFVAPANFGVKVNGPYRQDYLPGDKGQVITTYKGGEVRVYSEVEGRTTKWYATWQGPGMAEPKVFFSSGRELKAADLNEGTLGRAKLDELAGLKPSELQKMEYVWIGEEGQGRHVKIGTTKNSNHWFLLTPDGKGGFRTYHLGDQKPDKKKIQEKMANGGYSYLFGATDDPKDFSRSANYDGRQGKLVTKIGDAEIWTHQLESRGSGKWAAVLHRPGKEPYRFRTFDKPPTEADFKEGTEARKALDRILGVSTAPVKKKGERVQIEGIGDTEVWVEERKVGRSGKSQWVATVYVPGHEPTSFWRFDVKPGTGHFAPDKPARKELEEKIQEIRKASGASSTPQGSRQGSGTPVVTPTSLVNQQYVGTTGDERAMVLVGQLRGDDKWFVVTPKAGGGFNSYPLKEVTLTNGQLSDKTKARVRKMIEGGAFSQVWGGAESKPMSNPYRS